MKKFLISIPLMLLTLYSGYSQIRSSKPQIDPITNCQMRYYYYTNIEAYFDTQKKIYYYKENSEWITGEEIPDGYRGYSLYNKINVMINDYDDDNICQFLPIHKKKFPYTKKGNLNQITNIND